MRTLLVILLIVCATGTHAQQTVGLFTYNQQKSYNGLTLFCQMGSTTTYLLDNCGRVVHTWNSKYRPGHNYYMLEDGSLLRAGSLDTNTFKSAGSGGIIERIAWDGTVLWSYILSDDTTHQHHDIYPMPNGNILAIAWDKRNNAQAKSAGRINVLTDLWSEQIIEIKPTGLTTGEVVWRWRVWDHIIQSGDSLKPTYGIVKDHPERMNVNYGTLPIPDWLHANSIAYNPDLNQVIISMHNTHEFWIIDHSTTIAEAASSKGGRYGKGGDILYRWGNPILYNSGTAADQKLRGQHHAHWIPKGFTDAGNIMVFNNRAGGVGVNQYSSVDIIKPPMDEQGNYKLESTRFGPDSASWRYYGNPLKSFFSTNISGAERLPNGNTFICDGDNGVFFEVTPDNEIVWKYVNPVKQGQPIKQGDSISSNPVFRAVRYSYDYLKGKTLVGGNPIELEPLPSNCQVPTGVEEEHATNNSTLSIAPNPTSGDCTISFSLEKPQCVSLQVFDVLGNLLQTIANTELPSGTHSYILSNTFTGAMYVRLSCAEKNSTIPVQFIRD